MGPTDEHDLIKRLDVCLSNRSLELELFWKRAVYFGGFIAVAAAAYGSVAAAHPHLAAIFSTVGLVCAVAWSLANRGGKYWQENWEAKVEAAELDVVGVLHGAPEKPKTGNWWLRARRYSVSKLTIALSDFIAFTWLCVLGVTIAKVLGFKDSETVRRIGTISFTLLGLAFIGAMFAWAKSDLVKKIQKVESASRAHLSPTVK